MTVSVIVPVYNAERYIEECVNSILRQSITTLDVILIDDGSTDDSLKICKSFCVDPRVRVVSQDNQGVSAARNIGIENSCGELMMFVDADDVLPDNAVETLLGAMTQNATDLVVGQHIRLYGAKRQKSLPRLMPGIHRCDELLCRIVDDGTLTGILLGSACGVIYKANIIKQCDIRFKPIKYNEDGLFNIEYMLKSSSLYVIHDYVYCYRQTNTGSASRRSMSDPFNEVIKTELLNLDWDTTRYDLDKQLLLREVTYTLQAILVFLPRMNFREGASYLCEVLNADTFREGLRCVNYNRLATHKKIMYLLMRYKLYPIIFICVKYIMPCIRRV